jgi:hypothetical protein
MVVVFDYVGETKSANTPAEPGMNLVIQDLGATPAPEGMSTGAKVAIGVGVVGVSAAAYSYFTHGIVRRLIHG